MPTFIKTETALIRADAISCIQTVAVGTGFAVQLIYAPAPGATTASGIIARLDTEEDAERYARGLVDAMQRHFAVIDDALLRENFTASS